MTAVIPSIHVTKQGSNTNSSRPGIAGKVAVIGAFKTTETNPTLFMTADEAKASFGDDDTFNGCAVIDDLFTGASSLLCVNITTWSDATPPVPTKTIDATNLAAALAKIKGEDWDMLFVADTLTDTLLPVIDAFLDTTLEMKFPAGFVGILAGGTTSANVTSAGLAGDHCYGLLVQQLTVNGTTKSLLKSGAYYAGLLAGMSVGNTMTMKIIPGVTGVTPELSFETGGAGKAYVEAGITTVKCQDRTGGKYVVVNSEQPNGYDLYINRVVDYVIKEMSLHQFLGERNRTRTYNEIEQELDRVKYRCIDILDLLEDITYTIEKTDVNEVTINIISLLFAGVITRINVKFAVEVE